MIRYQDTESAWEGASDLALDLTPLLDILFIVLVFFILTANSIERVFEVDLPREGVEQSKPLEVADTITVTLFDEPAIWAVGDKKFSTWIGLEAALQIEHRENPDATLVVVGERGVDIERLLQLLTFLRSEGMDAAQIMMDNGVERRH